MQNQQHDTGLAKGSIFFACCILNSGAKVHSFEVVDVMRIFIGAVVALLLSGCVGPGDLARNDPTVRATSKKTPKQIALCVYPKWQDSRTDSSMAETENGYRLLVASNNMADEMLDIQQVNDGSAVALYQRMAWAMMPGRSSIETAVKSCI